MPACNRVLDRNANDPASQAQQADIIRLLLFTGCRGSEIVYLGRDEVKGDQLELKDSKTGPRTVLLKTEAREILDRRMRHTDSPWVFPSITDPSGGVSTPSHAFDEAALAKIAAVNADKRAGALRRPRRQGRRRHRRDAGGAGEARSVLSGRRRRRDGDLRGRGPQPLRPGPDAHRGHHPGAVGGAPGLKRRQAAHWNSRPSSKSALSG